MSDKDRCVHGVWKGDHCYSCESQPTPSQGSGGVNADVEKWQSGYRYNGSYAERDVLHGAVKNLQGNGERELPPLILMESDLNAAREVTANRISEGDYKGEERSAYEYPAMHCRERQLKAALAANADLERRVNDWESTLSMAGCWKDRSVPVGWVNKRAEAAEAANAAEYERGRLIGIEEAAVASESYVPGLIYERKATIYEIPSIIRALKSREK